jgi:FAD binding domain
VRTVVAQRAPAGFEVLSLGWSSYFRIHHRDVASLNVGRIFIAGDAAHIHSPFGGQGMNTGLQDVWNLAWKLDLVVRGRGSEQLLNSYSAERTPVIKGVIETTHRLTRALGSASKFAQAVRETAIPLISRTSIFQKRFIDNLSELGIAYAGSPIIEGPGRRFWDDSLRGGRGVESKFILFLPEAADASIRESAKQLQDFFCDLVDLRYIREPNIILVRPDGYIAYECPMNHMGVIPGSVRSLLERQTQPRLMHEFSNSTPEERHDGESEEQGRSRTPIRFTNAFHTLGFEGRAGRRKVAPGFGGLLAIIQRRPAHDF